GSCERCRAGHESTCSEFQQLRIDPGGFAERLHATHTVPLLDVAGLDGVWVEPLACILRAAERVPAGRVLVVGCGAVGRLWVHVLPDLELPEVTILPLERFDDGVDLYRRGDALKVVFTP